MEPTVQPNGHVCTTCSPGSDSPDVEPKQRRSRLNVLLAWALSGGRYLLWPADNPEVYERDSPWVLDRRMTVCTPRVTHSVGDRGLYREPGRLHSGLFGVALPFKL